MHYNGSNNTFFSFCQINDDHSFTSSSHTKKIKSCSRSEYHKNTLIDNEALSPFKVDNHERMIGLIQKMKGICDSLPLGRITEETDRGIHKHFINIALYANNKYDDRITRRVYLSKEEKTSIKVVYFINNVAIHNNTIKILQAVNSGYDFSHLSLKGIVIKDEDLSSSNFAGCKLQNAIFQDCNMYKADFHCAIMEKILFDNCILGDSNFVQIEMADGTLNTRSVTHVRFYNTAMNRASIKSTFPDCSNSYIAYMAEVNLYKVIASYVNLFKVGLSSSKLGLINSKHADLPRVNLNKAALQSTNLIDSKLFCMWLTNTFPEMAICIGLNMADVSSNNTSLGNCHFNCSILAEAHMFNVRLYRVNFDEASVQGMGISTLHGEEDIPIDSDTLVTLQRFFKKDYTSCTGMPQTEGNINAVIMKITADTMRHANQG